MPDFSKPAGPERPQSQQTQTQGQVQNQTQSQTQAPGRTQSQTQPFSRLFAARGQQSRGERAVGTDDSAHHDLAHNDLAHNAPGTRCVDRARQIRSEAPIKTRAERLLMVSRSREARERATAAAEKKVATALARLGPGWKVLHSVPIGNDKREVSHLVIGPGGVFTIASRAFRSAYRSRPTVAKDAIEAQVMGDSIRIHGETQPWIKEARAQAWRTSRALTAASGMTVYVRPAVVVLGVDEVRVYKPADRVDVFHRNHIVKWLERFPAVLDAASVDRIFGAARRGDTWVDPANALSRPAENPAAENPTVSFDKPE